MPGGRSSVSTATGARGKPIPVGVHSYPTAITLDHSGATAVVLDTYGGQVSLVSTRSRRQLARITVGSYPVAAAIAG